MCSSFLQVSIYNGYEALERPAREAVQYSLVGVFTRSFRCVDSKQI